ncbi:hypothetical protein F503_05631 [Ophiostoma piceae UAMH 11346]|uniref:F-box domain-containing protein n=1 Tax=Ophiostoma piceae (strain UAMH 11346) TaxID=1262450 RepID=S3CEL2_OPHP1|nr:hypothetical protein F503_05631 [Ophiostoma piceae UAMH 11346]
MEQQQTGNADATASLPPSLPTEVLNRIIDILIACPSSALRYASISQLWRTIIYRDLFQTLKVDSTTVLDLCRLRLGQLIDYAHWKLHHHTDIARPMTAARIKDLNLEFLKFKTYVDLGHRWQHAIIGPSIRAGGALRPFTRTFPPRGETN